MPSRTLKDLQDCRDFICGLKLMGTGGGGAEASGMEMLSGALEAGLKLSWVDASDLPEDACSCTAYGSGSISAETPNTLKEVEALGRKIGLPVVHGDDGPDAAVRELEAYTGSRVGALVAIELGASNTPAPMITAARMGIPLLDGDYSGRAVPQDMQTTYFLKDIPTYPAAIVDWWGNVLILKHAASTEMGESIGKMLSVAAHGVVYIASMIFTAKETRELIVPGTLTKSLELGRGVRAAREAGRDPAAEAVRLLEGWELFRGVVSAKESGDKEGTFVGTTHIEGSGKWQGHKMDVWFLNENHISWLDGKPYVFSPDLIILANPETGDGYTNSEIKPGDPVVALGAKVYPVFRSEKALKYFAPRFWGFDIDYVPIEEVMKGR